MISLDSAFFLLVISLFFFAWLGYKESLKTKLDYDLFFSARNSQNWLMIGLSLFASGMGIWILFGPSEVGYYGGFWDVVVSWKNLSALNESIVNKIIFSFIQLC